MFLKEIALRKAHEQMEAWDPISETFIPAAFQARIDLTDRFLSNFNKPTRRRMLFADNEVVFPESRTFRHPGTKDVYLLGITRQDALEGNPYLGLTICQLVTDVPGGSSGLATVTRRVPLGPADNPGWLVDTVVAKAFIDLEFRTSANEPDTTDVKIENFYAYLPINVVCQAWDFVELHGNRYRVVDTFSDSGLSGLRIDDEEDTRIDMVMKVSDRVYDKTSDTYINGQQSYNVTGVMENYHDYALWNNESQPYIDVYFEAEHLPFEPPANKTKIMVEGRERTVESVHTQPGRRQYKLRCK